MYSRFGFMRNRKRPAKVFSWIGGCAHPRRDCGDFMSDVRIGCGIARFSFIVFFIRMLDLGFGPDFHALLLGGDVASELCYVRGLDIHLR